MSYFSSVKVQAKDSPSIDSFGSWRTSQKNYRFDGQMTYGIDTTYLWDTLVTGTATVTHDSNLRAALLTLGTASGEYAVLQSHYCSPYSPGYSQIAVPTFRFGTAVANTEAEVGYGDDRNGIFLKQAGDGTLSAVLRSSVSGVPSGTSVTQANWNLDPMNGNGPSGINLLQTKTQILWIDGQALYSGRVRCGINVDGLIYYFHEFKHANVETNPYIQTFNLPLRWKIKNTGISAGRTMLAICGSVISEGGGNLFDIPGIPNTISSGATSVTATTTRTPVLSIRNRTTFNSLLNKSITIPLSVEVANTGNTTVLVEIIYNGNLSGASWGNVDTSNSTMERDVSASSITGGTIIDSFYVSSSATNKESKEKGIGSKVLLSLAADEVTPDILTVCCTAVSATDAVYANLNWKEIR